MTVASGLNNQGRETARRIAYTVVMVFIFIFVASILLKAADGSPKEVLIAMFDGAFGSRMDLGETLLKFTPIAVVALGLIPALRLGLFNIGLPGQIGFGALLSTVVALQLPELPSLILVPMCLLASIAGGAVCAWLPAWLRTSFGVKEILSTLVINFLVVLSLQYFLTGPMRGDRVNLPQSDPLSASAALPLLMEGMRANWGLVFVIIAIVLMLVIDRSPYGYRLRLMGAAPNLAKQAGISDRKMIIGALCFSGAMCGIAGWLQVAGVDHRLYSTVASPIGFTPLFAVLMGGMNPAAVLISSFVFAAILRGGESLQISVDISPEIISVLVGLMLILVASRKANWTTK